MTGWKTRLLTNWHPMRILRLGLAIMMLVASIQSKDYMIGAFSLFFLYQAVANTGCCGASGCSTPPPRRQSNEPANEDIAYEEIK